MSAGAGAAAAAIAKAIKASGVIVHVEPDDFVGVLKRQPGALVVHATGGFWSTNYQYLTSYKGLAFFTKAAAALDLPPGTELMQARRIWVPGGSAEPVVAADRRPTRWFRAIRPAGAAAELNRSVVTRSRKGNCDTELSPTVLPVVS